MTKPEDLAREEIDRQLLESGWVIQDQDEINLSAGQGVAVRYLQMKYGHSEIAEDLESALEQIPGHSGGPDGAGLYCPEQ